MPDAIKKAHTPLRVHTLLESKLLYGLVQWSAKSKPE